MSEGPTVSFEFFPPHSPAAESQLWTVMEKLAPLSPTFFSVTYGAGGSKRSRTERLVDRVHKSMPVAPAAHLTCVGATRAEIDAMARKWWQSGIRHIVALRGDPPQGEISYSPHPEGYSNAAALVEGLRKIADFEISVAGYPEMHPASPNLAADLDNLKRKVDAGARRVLTQYFFDNSLFYRFRDSAVAAGIKVPIVPGILPVTNFAKVVEFSEKCGTSVSPEMAKQFDGLDSDPETRNLIAASVAIEQCEDLLAHGVDAFHFYTLNRAALTYAICWRLGMRPTHLDGPGADAA
jgi:methylenetetrahydrofolate reductase (NADPH)